MNSRIIFARSIVCLSLALPTLATARELKDHPRREEVNERVRNQERRIRKGLKDGSMTPAQAAQLRSKLDGVKAQEKAEVQANGGTLTKGEQKQLNQELNQDGHQIFKDKHPRRAEVNERVNNQDKRINQGVKDGQLTAQQAAQLKGEEAGVKAEERAEVIANGGHLTRGEQKQINQELNQDSAQIHTERTGGQ